MKTTYYVLALYVLFITSCGIIINREDYQFTSKYDYISGTELKNSIINSNEDAVCIIIDPGCSGVDDFTPRVKMDLERIKGDEISTRVIVNMLNTQGNENALDSIIVEKHRLDHRLEIIDFKEHPVQTFKFKGKYDSFLTDLCGECNDKSLGYPFYVYYQDGKYIGKSYYLSEEIYKMIRSK